MSHRITLIPGDGIGPEVAEATRLAVEATGVSIEWDVQPAGAEVAEAEGTPMPDRVIASIRKNKVALKGPVTTPVGHGFRSVNVTLRTELDLYALLRPCRHYPGVRTRHPGTDLVVVRENTEDLYGGIEFEAGTRDNQKFRDYLRFFEGYRLTPDTGITVKPISAYATRRIVRFAFDYAIRSGRSKVTVGHKANIMRHSDGIFLQTARETSWEYPSVRFEEMQLDELAMWLVWEPQVMDVLLLPNLYGDIISDLCAGLIGGLGVAPGVNLGDEIAVFEATHGSAPDIAGKGLANPAGMMLSSVMMLRHIGEIDAAHRLESALARVMEEGKYVTRDLGGTSSGAEFADAVMGCLRQE
ncbi:MAG TPA: isocitrate/isopropylmalate dehydrogenase family protein [Actinomycetota bacterium]|nr:isocitrate/isopropylmalate dehydrogenase family protein [Actinomycetota bacterium]